jgi:hypothetical protein
VKNLKKMKTRIILSILLVTVFFTGCKNDKSVDSLEVVTPEVVDNTFKVTLKVIVKKDDDFALFFTEDGSINFKDDPIWHGVKGSESLQDVVFELPEGSYPTQLRMDLGIKKDQEDITLKSVKMEYKGKTREIVGAELINFFRADDSKCTFDPATGLIKAVGPTKAPSLYPQEANLGPEIAKLAK